MGSLYFSIANIINAISHFDEMDEEGFKEFKKRVIKITEILLTEENLEFLQGIENELKADK